MKERETVIEKYLAAYNAFDVEKMVADFDENIVFENISDGHLGLLLEGLVAFKKQAEQACTYFSSRMQTLTSIRHHGDESHAEIAYLAILAVDFPNGLKQGEELKLTGKSVFKFSGKKIVKLTDIS